MIFLWIVDIIFLAVVIPVVLVILHQVLTPLVQIRKYAEEIAEKGAMFGSHLDETVPELAKTRELVKGASPEIGRYLNAIDRVR